MPSQVDPTEMTAERLYGFYAVMNGISGETDGVSLEELINWG